jgi:glycosyltransferase involved in cell wall biosynthesis
MAGDRRVEHAGKDLIRIEEEERRLVALREEAARLNAELEQLRKLRPKQQVLPGWLNSFVVADALAKKIATVMERDGFIPDVAIGHDTSSLEALELLKQRFGTLTIFDAMEMPILKQRSGSYFRRLPRPAHEMMQPRIDHNIQRVDRVITVGPAMARRLREIYHRDIEVVLNSRSGAPVPRSDDLRRHVGAGEGDILCLFGNLIAEDYGFEEVAGALAYLPERFKLVNIGGFGGRDYEQKTREMIESSGYANRVLFGDPVAFDAVPNLFSGADLGIIAFKASLSENDKYALPNRFFDYCAACLPIFTTRIEDIAHFVESYDAGAVFPQLTPEAVANSILANLDNLPRWRRNSERLGQEVCWEKVATDYLRSLDPPGKKIAILIRRDITIHGRTHRAHRCLSQRGHTVKVFTTSGALPEPIGLRDVVHVREDE